MGAPHYGIKEIDIFMFPIIFSDVDGTLLDSRKQVLPATRDSIVEAIRRGIRFVIVTARPPMGVTPILKKNGFTCPIVAYGGGLLLDEDGTVLGSTTMPAQTAADIIAFVEERRFPLSWNLYSGNTWLVRDVNDPRVRREAAIVEAEPSQGDVSTLAPGQGVHKILCICEPDHLLAIEEAVRKRFPDVSVAKSSNILLEIMPRGVNKALAVNALCGVWKVSPQSCVAFGDNYNDVEMLDAVGCPVIMGNAPEALLSRYARVAPDNDHDGIAFMLKQLLAES